MPRAGFEPGIPATKRPQTCTLDRAAFGLCRYVKVAVNTLKNLLRSVDRVLYKLYLIKLDVLVLVEVHKFSNYIIKKLDMCFVEILTFL
jgi:hypothetical protein